MVTGRVGVVEYKKLYPEPYDEVDMGIIELLEYEAIYLDINNGTLSALLHETSKTIGSA